MEALSSLFMDELRRVIRAAPAGPRPLFAKARVTSTGRRPLTSCALAGSLQDELRDCIRLRDQRQVTRLDLYGLGAHTLSHESLQVRIDRAILGRNGVITRL